MTEPGSFLGPPLGVEESTFWLLNARVGWQAADLQDVAIAPSSETLVLARVREGNRSLTEASGSFGGLVPPALVALDANNLYLVDTASAQLKLFDRCHCRFNPLPCFKGVGRDPRQLSNAQSITISNGNLYVADTGNGSVKVFSLHGLLLRGLLRPPAKANLTTWEPYGLACDRRGRVYVTDATNGLIHRFSRSGQWSLFAAGLSRPTHIAVDDHDNIYVVVGEGPEAVAAFDPGGRPITVPLWPAELAPRFPHLPFSVDAAGQLDLTELCLTAPEGNQEAPWRFDQRGVLLPKKTVAVAATPQYVKQGKYYSQPLDSEIYRCQWHRVILRGHIPPGTRVEIATYTAEVEQPAAVILDLPDSAWATQPAAEMLDKGDWDILVRSGGGRYLWLRLTLKGNELVTPSLESVRVEFPRLSLRRYLPAVFGFEPVSADFTDRFLSIFETTWRGLEAQIDHQARLFDSWATPAEPLHQGEPDFLSWLASWIGVVLDRQMPEAKRRHLVANAARLYRVRGTRRGLWQQLLLFLGLQPETICCPGDQPRASCQPKPANCAPVKQRPCAWQPPPLILEHFQVRRWLFLGAGRLGDQAEVWGRSIVNRSQLNENAQAGRTQLIAGQDPFRDPFHVYAHKFSVFVPACYGRSDGDRRALQNLIRLEMPAHTHMQLEFVEPRFRIGLQASIGLNTVVGRYPEGVTLNTTSLGPASLLSSPPGQADGPSLSLDQATRIGSTSRLD